MVTSVQDFADNIKDNPQEIIKWAKKEIQAYKKLIKLLENNGCQHDWQNLKNSTWNGEQCTKCLKFKS